LEALADPNEIGEYTFGLNGEIIDPRPVFTSLLADLRAGVSMSSLSARFHNSLARLCAETCAVITKESGIRVVALSGGVWQNRLLFERTLPLLQGQGYTVLTHTQLPPNDGCIGLGQAAVAAELHQHGSI
ncbi:MAG TPA: hypothetical protein VHO48_08595, partial [Anaerolineaceae bacterium]|nr:hypothetical protein [Anaerolineaceae bacterium]